MTVEERFWESKKLTEMSAEEWEALCDGCARCCLIKLRDADTNEILYTNIVCNLLDVFRCRCRDYKNRNTLVPSCVVLSPEVVEKLDWMPKTCAYRLLSEGKNLPDWHPLISGDPESVHRAGISVRHRVILEKDVDITQIEDYIVDWLG